MLWHLCFTFQHVSHIWRKCCVSPSRWAVGTFSLANTIPTFFRPPHWTHTRKTSIQSRIQCPRANPLTSNSHFHETPIFRTGRQARVHRGTADMALHSGVGRHEHDTIQCAHRYLHADRHRDDGLTRRRSLTRPPNRCISTLYWVHNFHLKASFT